MYEQFLREQEHAKQPSIAPTTPFSPRTVGAAGALTCCTTTTNKAEVSALEEPKTAQQPTDEHDDKQQPGVAAAAGAMTITAEKTETPAPEESKQAQQPLVPAIEEFEVPLEPTTKRKRACDTTFDNEHVPQQPPKKTARFA
jgi:hypothetical protein